jgi:hypothetical protein
MSNAREEDTAPTTTQQAPLPGTVALPAPGVYRYRTVGSERIDALGGTSHAYPAETTITVVADGCGVRLRWEALRERYEEWQLCASAAGIELQPDAVQYHEFFGRTGREELTCDRAVVVVPLVGTSPAPADLTCRLADDPWAPRWEVLESSTRRVDGVEIEIRHVRMTIDDTDAFWEDQVLDWYLAANGLPVEVTVTKSSRSPSIVGPVVYDEEYRLELISLAPLR